MKILSWQVPQNARSAAAKPDLKSASRSALMDLQSSAHTLRLGSCFPPGSQPWESCINEERQGQVKHNGRTWTCFMGLHVIGRVFFPCPTTSCVMFFSQLLHLHKTNCARLKSIGDMYRAWGHNIGEKSRTLCIQHAIQRYCH